LSTFIIYNYQDSLLSCYNIDFLNCDNATIDYSCVVDITVQCQSSALRFVYFLVYILNISFIIAMSDEEDDYMSEKFLSG